MQLGDHRALGGIPHSHQGVGVPRRSAGHAGAAVAPVEVHHTGARSPGEAVGDPVRDCGVCAVLGWCGPGVLHLRTSPGLPDRRQRRRGRPASRTRCLPRIGDVHDAGLRHRVRVPDRADLRPARRHRRAAAAESSPPLRHRRHRGWRSDHHALRRPDHASGVVGAAVCVLRAFDPGRLPDTPPPQR